MKYIKSTHKQAGFSLIEILITCILIMILSAASTPSFKHILRKSCRTNTQMQLQLWRLRLLQAQSLKVDITKIGVPPNKHYKLRQHRTNTDTELIATPIGAQAHDSCAQLSIWMHNSQPDKPFACWQ